jgi:isoamylase
MSAGRLRSGASAPLGATVRDGGVNFSVFSKGAALVELLLFDDANAVKPAGVNPLDADKHRTYDYWHVFMRTSCHHSPHLRRAGCHVAARAR